MDLTDIAICTKTMHRWRDEDYSFWDNSLFERFRNMSSKKKGAQAERLVADILESLGHHISRKKNGDPKKPKGAGTDYDLVVNSFKVEVKSSTSWDSIENKWKWQQLRSLQVYDRIIFVGVNPNHVYLWWCTKQDLIENVFGNDSFRQHGGKNGKQETYWVCTDGGTDLRDVPKWFHCIGTWND